MIAPSTLIESGDFLHLIPDPVIGFDAENRIAYWSPSAEATYGFTPDEAIGRRAPALLQTSFPMPELEILEILGDTGRWQGNLVQRTKDGRELTVESRWVARDDEHGKVLGGLRIDRDVTARAELEREHDHVQAESERDRLQSSLRRSQRLDSLAGLAGGIAHDFNNMLAVIINYAALVSSELDAVHRATGEERWASMRGDVGEIQLAAERAAGLTRELLAFSRQEVGKPFPLSLNESIQGVEELLHRTLGEHIGLVTSLAEDLRPVRADPAQMDQVLVNLAANARDAMPGGGTLTIETANVEIDADYADAPPELSPDQYVRLRVSDTGVGMAPEMIERAFDPFVTTKPMGQGTGLGLASVYGIIRQAGGHAALHSQPGEGTTFIALLPVSRVTGGSPEGALQHSASAHDERHSLDPRPRAELGGRVTHVGADRLG
jgi:PAS domain S-box-containing protein